MISLDILTENFWENLYASNIRYRLFVKDMYQRIKLSGVPELVALLSDTLPFITTYSNDIDFLANNIGEQKLATYDKNQTLFEYLAEVRGLAGAVIDVFKGKKSKQYSIEFFPHNVDEYAKLTEITADLLFARTKNLTEKYEIELGTPRKDRFADLADQYSTLHQSQQNAITNVGKSNIKIKLSVIDVKLISFRNILRVAAFYYKTPEEVKNFYRESFLHCRHKDSHGKPIDSAYKKNIAKESILLTDFSYSDTDKVLFENLGKDSLYYFSRDLELDSIVIPEDAIELISGEELLVEASTLKKFLYIANKSTLVAGKIQLSLI